MARDLNIKGTAGIVDNDQYVYRKERDISKTMVDWGQAAKDITQTIETIRDDRASQKADLEEKSRTRMNELAKLEQYDSETLNTKMIGASHEGGNFIQMQNDLMRRGLINPSEFLQSTQQLSDNFTQLKTATKGWDAHYKTAMSRLEKDPKTGLPTANAMEQFINEGMAGFGNLANLDLIVNPTTGTLSFLKKGADENDPANHQSLNTINARMTQRSDYYDLSTGVQNEVENLGEVVTSEYMARQGVKTTTDWYKLEGNKELMADLVETQMATDSQKISIMQTHMNLSSDNMTRDENDPRLNPESDEYDESTVLVVANPDGSGSVKPVFSQAQEDKMKEVVANRFRAQIDKKIELVKGYQPQQDTPYTGGQRKERNQNFSYVDQGAKIVSGTQQEFQEGVTTLSEAYNNSPKGQKNPLADNPVDRNSDPNFILITYQSGEVKKIPRYQLDSSGDPLLDDNGNKKRRDQQQQNAEILSYMSPVEGSTDQIYKEYNKENPDGIKDYGGSDKEVNFLGEGEAKITDTDLTNYPVLIDGKASQLSDKLEEIATSGKFDGKKLDLYKTELDAVLSKELKDLNLPYKVEVADEWFSTNSIYVTIDGNKTRIEFKPTQASKLLSELQEAINTAKTNIRDKRTAEKEKKNKEQKKKQDDKKKNKKPNVG